MYNNRSNLTPDCDRLQILLFLLTFVGGLSMSGIERVSLGHINQVEQ